MSTLTDIEHHTKTYAAAREALAGAVLAMQDDLRAIERRYLPKIKRCVAAAAEAQSALQAEIEAAPHLFVKPRTLVFHGVKVGYQKGKGRIEWEDDDVLVERIRKILPEEQFDLVVKTVYKPLKSGLQELDTGTLKRLGVTVEDTGDVVVIKPADAAVDKVVAALLKEATEDVGA